MGTTANARVGSSLFWVRSEHNLREGLTDNLRGRLTADLREGSAANLRKESTDNLREELQPT